MLPSSLNHCGEICGFNELPPAPDLEAELVEQMFVTVHANELNRPSTTGAKLTDIYEYRIPNASRLITAARNCAAVICRNDCPLFVIEQSVSVNETPYSKVVERPE